MNVNYLMSVIAEYIDSRQNLIPKLGRDQVKYLIDAYISVLKEKGAPIDEVQLQHIRKRFNL